MENEDKKQMKNDTFRKAQALVVDHLSLNPQDEDGTKIFTLWKRELEIYLQTLEANNEENFNILINRLGSIAYEYVDAANTYKDAITKLEKLAKVTNFERRRQGRTLREAHAGLGSIFAIPYLVGQNSTSKGGTFFKNVLA